MRFEALSRFLSVRYNLVMSASANSRASAAVIVFGLLAALPAHAQTFTGFNTLPYFAWPKYDPADTSPFEGSYARMSTGYQVTSSKSFGTFSGPTIGLEGGKMWREGQFVYGFVGALDYMPSIGGYRTPSFGTASYTRDFAGTMQFKAGILAANNVLLYTKIGATAVNETLHFGATNFSSPFDRKAFAVRPDARIGAEWAVTDKLTIGIEAGVMGPAMR
jgi:outer membrane immunogenic protein